MHRPSAWAGGLSIFILLLIILIQLGGDSLYDYPPNPAISSLPKDSVIVCLAGGRHRVEAAYSLYANGVGDRLWVIGAGKKTTVMGLAKVQASEVAQNIPWDRVDRIQVETESRNTIENAFAVKRYLEQFPQVKNVILVTSPYHMRRSMMMISQHISQEIKIIPFTPTNADFGLKNWWHSWTGISVTVSELVKFRLANIVIPRLKYF